MLETDIRCHHCFCRWSAGGECCIVEEMEGASVSVRKCGLERMFFKIGFHLYEQFYTIFYTVQLHSTCFLHIIYPYSRSSLHAGIILVSSITTTVIRYMITSMHFIRCLCTLFINY